MSFAIIVVAAFCSFLWLERRLPLRRSVEPGLGRVTKNMTVAVIAAVVLQLAGWLLLEPLAALGEKHHLGLSRQFPLPGWLQMVLAVVLLDYTLYVWHILTHRLSWLWRFHQVHHVDLDLDSSTALRFHFGEHLLSIPWRAGQILLIGVSPMTLAYWQTALLIEIIFHHSNVKLPLGAERLLSIAIVTPRMHGIHHSIVSEETDSNFSSGLTIWDRLHGTLRLNVPQDQLTIGVPAYQLPQEVTLGNILHMPFFKQKASRILADGTKPERQSPLGNDRHKLAP